jgi:single-strand DNA-binding protein
MASYNKITLVGNAGNDPQLRIVGDNRKVTEISLAINEKGRNGQPDKTEWYRVSLWDAKAEIAANYVRKGNPVMVEGRLSVRTYVDPNTQRDRYSLEVTATEIVLVTSRADGEGQPAGNASYQQPQAQPQVAQQPVHHPAAPAMAATSADDDLPF